MQVNTRGTEMTQTWNAKNVRPQKLRVAQKYDLDDPNRDILANKEKQHECCLKDLNYCSSFSQNKRLFFLFCNKFIWTCI